MKMLVNLKPQCDSVRKKTNRYFSWKFLQHVHKRVTGRVLQEQKLLRKVWKPAEGGFCGGKTQCQLALSELERGGRLKIRCQ